MNFRNVVCLLLTLALFSCASKKKSAKNDPLASDRTFSIEMRPFWGGSAGGTLERKNGKDQLRSEYVIHQLTADSSTHAFTAIEKAAADSIFLHAGKMNWTPISTMGTAEEQTALRITFTYRIGMNKRTITFDRLKNADELPPDALQLVKEMNAVSPEGFKLY